MADGHKSGGGFFRKLTSGLAVGLLAGCLAIALISSAFTLPFMVTALLATLVLPTIALGVTIGSSTSAVKNRTKAPAPEVYGESTCVDKAPAKSKEMYNKGIPVQEYDNGTSGKSHVADVLSRQKLQETAISNNR